MVEMMQVAQKMHQCMVEANESDGRVLKWFRKAGWGAWQPRDGKLVEVDTLPWGKKFSMECNKIDEDNVPQPLPPGPQQNRIAAAGG